VVAPSGDINPASLKILFHSSGILPFSDKIPIVTLGSFCNILLKIVTVSLSKDLIILSPAIVSGF